MASHPLNAIMNNTDAVLQTQAQINVCLNHHNRQSQ